MTPTTEVIILVVSSAVFGVVLISGRLSRASITEPLVAVVVGLLIGVFLGEPMNMGPDGALGFLELTLGLVLFTDAARIDIPRLREHYGWPARMLVIGLPLAMIFGAVAGSLLFAIPFGAALLLGVILAPTDAALAEPVLESEELPVRIRQALNVESGLNDGLALPALFIAIGFVDAEAGATLASSVLLVVQQIGVGIVGGVLFGLFGAWGIGRAIELEWVDRLHVKIAAVGLALAAFAAVQLLDGSGFVATFVAGGVLGARIRPHSEHLYEFAETEGRALVLVAFLFIGAGPVYGLFVDSIPWEVWAVALISLFIARPIAIAVSLVGKRLLGATVLFLGWFGPRGLATAVFLLVVLEEMVEMPPVVAQATYLTLALSVLLHGLTARPLSSWVARAVERRRREEMPEMGEAFEHPMR